MQDQPALRKAVTGRLLLVFVLGDVLGAGVYALVGEIAGETGGAVWLPFLVALALALLTAASYAELVTRFPRAGGAAVFAREAYGSPLLSFLVGFCMLAAGVTSAAGLALAFGGDYLGVFLEVPAALAAALFLVLVGLLNARGIKESLRANVVMTVVEVGGLLLILVLAAVVLGRGDGDPGRAFTLREDTTAVSAVLGASLLAFYSFVGFETSANLAEEMEDPRRDYPRALFGALLAAGAVYVLLGLAVPTVVDPGRLSESTGPLLEVVRAADVGIPDQAYSLVALIAVANGALLTLIMASRLTFGMARDGLLPPVLARVLPARRTPGVAIAVTTALAIVLATTGTLEALAETVVLLLLLVFISTNVAVLVLRRRPAERPHFRAWTPLPVLGVLSCLVLLGQQSAGTWLRAGLSLAVGAALYGLAQAARRATTPG